MADNPDNKSPTASKSEDDVPMDTVFTNFKAGMEGVDTEKIKSVVHEMSKASHLSLMVGWPLV